MERSLKTPIYLLLYIYIYIFPYIYKYKYIYIYSFIYIHTYINIYIYAYAVSLLWDLMHHLADDFPSRSLRHPLSEAKDASTNSRGTVPDRSDRLFRHRAIYAIWKIRVWARKQRWPIWLFYQEKWINMVENHDQTRKQWGSGCFFCDRW